MLMIFWEFKPGIGQQVTATYCEEPQKGDKKLEAPPRPNLKKRQSRKSELWPSKPQ